MKKNLEMVTTIDANGFVISIEFVREDGGRDKISINREEKEED